MVWRTAFFGLTVVRAPLVGQALARSAFRVLRPPEANGYRKNMQQSIRILGFAGALVLTACGSTSNTRHEPVESVTPTNSTFSQQGIASWYGGKFHGRLTANGERYDKNGISAAHPFLPFGTRVRVTHRENGRSVVVRINDRTGRTFRKERVIDLSEGAARELQMIDEGVAPVVVKVID